MQQRTAKAQRQRVFDLDLPLLEMAMTQLSLHPLCTLFPRLDGAAFDSLRNDIAAHGLRHPIVTHDGMILDGGNRYRACIDAGIKPAFVKFAGENLVSFVLSANLHRRHMSAGQQAAIVASATDWGRAHKHGGNRKPDQGEGLHLETVAQRAAAAGATTRTQKDADKLVRESPALAKQVAQGDKSLYQAVKEAKPASKILPRKVAKPAAAVPAPAKESKAEKSRADRLTELEDANLALREENKALRLELVEMAEIADGFAKQIEGPVAAAKEITKLQGQLRVSNALIGQHMTTMNELKRSIGARDRQIDKLKAAAK